MWIRFLVEPTMDPFSDKGPQHEPRFRMEVCTADAIFLLFHLAQIILRNSPIFNTPSLRHKPKTPSLRSIAPIVEGLTA